MPTFVDESGDTGHDPGSLPYFRLAAVWVPCHGTANRFREAIKGIRTRLGLKASHEFKFAWTHDKPEHREAFYAAALSVSFRFAVCAIDKSQGDWRTADAKMIHWACGVSIACSLRDTYREAEAAIPPKNGKPRFLRELVVVDDNRDEGFLKTLDTCLSGIPSAQDKAVPLVGKVKFRGSGPDEMLQLADMICGATGAHASGAGGGWYGMIRERCVGLITLP